jgi:hypothetical protein
MQRSLLRLRSLKILTKTVLYLGLNLHVQVIEQYLCITTAAFYFVLSKKEKEPEK